MAVQTAPAQNIQIQGLQISSGYLRIKRWFDIAFTLLLSPLLLLVGTVIALCIKLDSEGPVFYRQKRIGQDGAEFYMLKFRSMYVGNHQHVQTDRVQEMMKNGQVLTKDLNDPRITRVGRIIRKTSLDEIPQFWNVLRGEMSLVGPRPPLPKEVEIYRPHDLLRLTGKPGLTGTWQVYGRSRVTFDTMVDMDIEYLSTQSLWLDLKLIVLTIPVMLLAKGGA
jgi:lipopolysaccharide/colanic/teichoic acid biosynthesis glycosyltransferase